MSEPDRDSNDQWKQMQDEMEQWLSDHIAQEEYQNWSDKLNLTEKELEHEHKH